jgi:hypothetical protein
MGPLELYLYSIKNWLDAPENGQQVVTLLLTNGDGVDVSKFDKAFKNVGLDKLAFAPAGVLALDDWPTLQELIDSGKRLVVFLGMSLLVVQYSLSMAHFLTPLIRFRSRYVKSTIY